MTPGLAGAVSADRGSALLIALLVMLVLNAVGLGLLTMVDVERRIAMNHREAAELSEAASAAAESAIGELARAASLSHALSGQLSSAFRDGSLTPVTPALYTLDLVAETARLQSTTDAEYRRGADNPRWRLFSYLSFASLSRTTAPREYLVSWVADDPSEADGNPEFDTNNVILVRSRAIGRGRAHRDVELALSNANGRLTLVSWREVR
jgi:hypothetical protein